MAQIRSKQIKDFLSTVNWAEVTTSGIANASDVKNYVDTEVSSLNTDTASEIERLDGELAAEISATSSDVTRLDSGLTAEINATNSEVTRLDGSIATEKAALEAADVTLQGNIDAEKAKIDAVLLASSADKDSFSEIVSLINAVDLVNDDALGVVIGNLTAEINSTNSDVTRLDGSIATEKAAYEAADTAAKAAYEAADGTLQGNIDALETAHDSRLDALEGAIIEDDQMAVETFVGAGFSYTLANAVQEDQASLVDVFVNGHRVFVATVSGAAVTLSNPGYVIDAQDEVVFVYQF